MWWDEDVRYNALSNDRIEEFLSSVQFLDLRNTYFAWHSTAYHGLLELSLYLDFQIDFHLFPTQLEVKNILLSSPRLHTVFLKLTTSLRHQDHSVEPIRLNNLRNLTLLCYEESGCLGLLPLIGPGPNGLDVTLSVHYDPTIATEQCSFFDRSALKTLRVRPIDADFWLGLISAKLPHLESLVLDSCHFGDGDLRDFLHLLSTSDSHVSPWPKLRTLELEECRIDGDLLEQFLSIHSIRTIRLYGGRIVDPISGRRVALSDAMYEFEQRFSSIVQEIKYLPRRPLS
ncbi:hypothetical protein BDV93DRAFT_529959 [Ceratobasidium sp. AG-I]|nr:hypothetical protein BDV93DRAFT_529959 [Ceratobasidium sp. AG-I]